MSHDILCFSEATLEMNIVDKLGCYRSQVTTVSELDLKKKKVETELLFRVSFIALLRLQLMAAFRMSSSLLLSFMHTIQNHFHFFSK